MNVWKEPQIRGMTMKIKRTIEIEESVFEIIKGLDKATCSSVVDSAYEAIARSTPYNPSDDAISRSGIKNTVVDLACNPNDMCDEQVCAFNGALQMVCDAIDNAPAVNERPKGEWILQYRNLNGEYYTCSQCGRMILVDAEEESLSDYPFCNCGTDMREE